MLVHPNGVMLYLTIVAIDKQRMNQYLGPDIFITSPPEGVARYCFHPVCVSVCLSVCLSVYLCVRPIFWYFISRLLEEISI